MGIGDMFSTVTTSFKRGWVTNAVAHKTDGRNVLEKTAMLVPTAVTDTFNMITGGAIRSASIGAKIEDMKGKSFKESTAYVANLKAADLKDDLDKFDKKDHKIDQRDAKLKRQVASLEAKRDKLSDKKKGIDEDRTKYKKRVEAAEALCEKNGGDKSAEDSVSK